jgi:hypothetical protein
MWLLAVDLVLRSSLYNQTLVPQGCGSLLCFSLVNPNLAALKVHEKRGFEIYGKEMRALKTDRGYSNELLMMRFLR